MIPSTPEKLIDSWIGECKGSQITGLFDPELQSAAPHALNSGDIVLVGDSISILAPAPDAFNRVLRLLAKFKMNPIHPNPVLHEAARSNSADALSDTSLTDLTDLPFVTIDNEESKDLDQALFLSCSSDKSNTNRYQVYYALADAAWFVKPATQVHDEALRRGVTYYAPALAVTMLPAVLSEDLVSLNEGVERRALVFQLGLSDTGILQSTQILRAKIRSRAKLSYDGVQAYYDAQTLNNKHPYANQSWSNSLNLLRLVGELRLNDAVERDVISFNRREARTIIDPEDRTKFSVKVRQRNDVERYNEQVSLLCNTAGAEMLDKMELLTPELQAVYRIHLPPLAIRLQRFQTQLTALLTERKLGAEWQWQGTETLADYVHSLPTGREHVRLRQAIERMIMLTNRASSYAEDAEIHHALGVDAYARFSSPMREIVGIFTHKELLEALDMEPARNRASDIELRTSVIEIANESKKRQTRLEKECQLLAMESFLAGDLALPSEQRLNRSATIMGIANNKIYLSLDSFALDLKLYLEDLAQQFNCQYKTNKVAATPSNDRAPSLVVGDEISVRTERWDESRRRYIFKVQ